MTATTCTSYYNDPDPCLHCAEAVRQEKEAEVEVELQAFLTRSAQWGIRMKPEYVNNMRNVLLARAGILDPSTPRYDEIVVAADATLIRTKKGIKS